MGVILISIALMMAIAIAECCDIRMGEEEHDE